MVAGAGFYFYYKLQCIKLDKEEKNLRKKNSVLCLQKTFKAVFKNGFSPALGSIPRLPFLLCSVLPLFLIEVFLFGYEKFTKYSKESFIHIVAENLNLSH